MEIKNKQNVISSLNYKNYNSEDKAQSMSFKAAAPAAALNSSGNFMQLIENGGFLVSFIIQDFLGMTVPRSIAGYMRDKEVTGKYNTQEGIEVLGREGLTGPCMMAVAPISLYFAAKCGRSTSVNSQLIKRFGDNLTEFVSAKDFDETLLKDKDKFKEVFYRNNIRNILNNTVGAENVKDESIDYIMTQLKNREKIPDGVKLKRIKGKSRYRNECMDNIVNHINSLKYEADAELNMLRKVKFGSEHRADIKAFDTKNVFEAMEKYSHDAITANNRFEKLNKLISENIKYKSLGKRFLTNIAMIAATLSVLSILPKIYARSNVAPGARKNINENDKNTNNPSFKGKNDKEVLTQIGKLFNKIKSDFVANELEYNGHNFTNTLMAGLSLFGLLVPRGLRAYNRAQKDENGKKDFTEIWEILLRDVTSSLAVIFAVPMGTRACVTSYEKKSGFVLMDKNRNKSKMKTVLDLLNPYSKSHVLSNSELTALYSGVDSKEKMINFCKYIDKNGGDLQKILSKSDNHKVLFNENNFTLDSIRNLTKSEKNKKIKEFFENIEKHTKINDSKLLNEKIINLMRSAGGSKNKIASFARGMNSLPGLLTTFIISPYILGWFIPRLTYKNTRRIHAKEDLEKEQKQIKANA